MHSMTQVRFKPERATRVAEFDTGKGLSLAELADAIAQIVLTDQFGRLWERVRPALLALKADILDPQIADAWRTGMRDVLFMALGVFFQAELLARDIHAIGASHPMPIHQLHVCDACTSLTAYQFFLRWLQREFKHTITLDEEYARRYGLGCDALTGYRFQAAAGVRASLASQFFPVRWRASLQFPVPGRTFSDLIACLNAIPRDFVIPGFSRLGESVEQLAPHVAFTPSGMLERFLTLGRDYTQAEKDELDRRFAQILRRDRRRSRSSDGSLDPAPLDSMMDDDDDRMELDDSSPPWSAMEALETAAFAHAS